VSVFVLLALFAPTQLPAGAQQGWVGDLFIRIDPFSSSLHYLGKVVVDGHGADQAASWLLSPVIAASAAVLLALGASRFVTLRGEAPS